MNPRASKRLGRTPREMGVLLTIALLFSAVIFVLVDRDRSLRLEGETMHLRLATLRADDLTFEIGEATVFEPAASPALPSTSRTVSGALDLQVPTEVDFHFDPAADALTMVFSARSGALPRIGGETIPFGTPVVFSRAEMRKIALVRATGAVTIGQAARSNSTAHLVQASYTFLERVPGLGEVTTLTGSLGRFDVVEVFDQISDSPSRSDVMIDLSSAPLRIWVEAAEKGAAPVLSIRRKPGENAQEVGPGWRDRLLANPLFQIATTVLSIALLIGQIMSIAAGSQDALPSAKTARPTVRVFQSCRPGRSIHIVRRKQKTKKNKQKGSA